MKKILIDFDDVIYDLFGEGLELYNKKYNRNLTINDITEYKASKKLLECLEEVKYTMMDKKNAIFYIKELIKYYDVYIVTASLRGHLCEKFDWIEKYLPEIGYNKTIVAKDKHMILGDIIRDDYAVNIIGHNAEYRFLYNMPYNRQIIESDKIIKINDLGDVIDFLKRCDVNG